MFVPAETIEAFTGKKRPSAQARFLAAREIKFTQRDDGSIALRQEELDRHTLSAPNAATAGRRWRQDLSALDKAG